MSIKCKVFKHKAKICILIATVLFLSSVCLEQVKAQSFFAYSAECQKETFVNTTEVKLVTNCSHETLGIRNSRLSNPKLLRVIPIRRFFKLLVLELPMVRQRENLSTFFLTAHLAIVCFKSVEAEILYFIHQSDGKKRA